MNYILSEVAAERSRQERLKASGKFERTCADADMEAGEKLAVLTEEVGEVAKAICERKKLGASYESCIREELIQVAAVAVAWVESLDSMRPDPVRVNNTDERVAKAKLYVKRMERLVRPDGRGCSYIQLCRLKEARRIIACQDVGSQSIGGKGQ